MAGACLPVLAPGETTAGTRAFDASHRWETAHALLDEVPDDEFRACAVGAMSYLWVDVIAHNHFVPAHENLWWNVPLLTHVACPACCTARGAYSTANSSRVSIITSGKSSAAYRRSTVCWQDQRRPGWPIVHRLPWCANASARRMPLPLDLFEVEQPAAWRQAA